MAAGAEGDSNLPMSHVGREQVLDALKAAFVHGRLAKDEFDLRVGQVLAAYAELDAATADIPTGLTTAQPPETVRKSHNRKLIQCGTAAGAGASVALTATIAVVAGGKSCNQLGRRGSGRRRCGRPSGRAADAFLMGPGNGLQQAALAGPAAWPKR